MDFSSLSLKRKQQERGEEEEKKEIIYSSNKCSKSIPEDLYHPKYTEDLMCLYVQYLTFREFIPLLYLCKRWNKVLMNNPLCWKYMELVKGIFPTSEQLNSIDKIHNTYPLLSMLDISFLVQFQLQKRFFEILKNYTNLSSLKLCYRINSYETEEDFKDCYFPKLKSIEINKVRSRGECSLDNIMKMAPNLEELQMIGSYGNGSLILLSLEPLLEKKNTLNKLVLERVFIQDRSFFPITQLNCLKVLELGLLSAFLKPNDVLLFGNLKELEELTLRNQSCLLFPFFLAETYPKLTRITLEDNNEASITTYLKSEDLFPPTFNSNFYSLITHFELQSKHSNGLIDPELFSYFHSLESLILRDCYWKEEDLLIYLGHHNRESLKHLEISCAYETDETNGSLPNLMSLHNFSNLSSLRLCYNTFKKEYLSPISQLTNLKFLNLVGCIQLKNYIHELLPLRNTLEYFNCYSMKELSQEDYYSLSLFKFEKHFVYRTKKVENSKK